MLDYPSQPHCSQSFARTRVLLQGHVFWTCPSESLLFHWSSRYYTPSRAIFTTRRFNYVDSMYARVRDPVPRSLLSLFLTIVL